MKSVAQPKIRTMCEMACRIRDMYGYKWVLHKPKHIEWLLSDSPIGPFSLKLTGRKRSNFVVLLSAGPFDGWTGGSETCPEEQKYYAALIHEMSHLTLMDGSPEDMGTEEEGVVLETAWLDALRPTREIRAGYREYSIDKTEIVIDYEKWATMNYSDIRGPKKMKWWEEAQKILIEKGVLTKGGAPTWKRTRMGDAKHSARKLV